MAAEAEGLIGWLVYGIIALVTGFLALWNTYVTGRVKRVEKRSEDNEGAVQRIELNISERFAKHEREERDRDEKHSKEVANEFKETRKEMNEGHAAILQRVNEVARTVKENGRT